MDPLWQAVIWSAIPVALLLLALAISVYAFRRGRPRRQDDPVERAYFDAQARAASEPGRSASRELPASSR